LADSDSHNNDDIDLYSASFQGFKLYLASAACCEFCARQDGCHYWATPPARMLDASAHKNGCEFWFSSTYTGRRPLSYLLGDIDITYPEDDAGIRRRRRRRHRTLRHRQRQRRLFMSTVHGPVLDRNVYQPGYFVGCRWSQWFTLDFPCLNAAWDDAVLFAEPLLLSSNFMPPVDVTSTTFHFQPPSVSTTATETTPLLQETVNMEHSMMEVNADQDSPLSSSSSSFASSPQEHRRLCTLDDEKLSPSFVTT